MSGSHFPVSDGNAGAILQWVESSGVASLAGVNTDSDWMGTVKEIVQRAAHNPALVHGLRTENMFATVFPSLGEVKLLKREDSGAPEFAAEDVKTPDFRAIDHSGSNYLIEVKNHHTTGASPIKPYAMRIRDFDAYRTYADMTQCELLIAVFWSSWGFWSLNGIDAFEVRDRKAWLTFDTAMKSNRMSDFGDRWLFPEFPISVVFRASPGSLVEDGNNMRFTIGSIDMYCADRQLTTETDRRLATFFAFWGDWPLVCGDAYRPDGEPAGVEYVFRPDPEPSDVPYAGIGSWSEMLSKQFRYRAVEGRDGMTLGNGQSLPEVNKILEDGAEHSDLGLRVLNVRPVLPGESEAF